MKHRDRPPRSGPARGTAGVPDRIASAVGAAPARSALTLRLVLAIFGLILFAATTVTFLLLDLPAGPIVVAAVLAATAAVDIAVIAARRRR